MIFGNVSDALGERYAQRDAMRRSEPYGAEFVIEHRLRLL